MRPVGLTRVLESGDTEPIYEPIYVNPAHIVSFVAGWQNVGSYVHLVGDESYVVRETPEQIIGLLADHRSTMRAEERDGIQVYR